MVSEGSGMFYRRLGVRRIINAGSWLTVLGGSIMPPAVIKAMEDASRWFVDMNELNAKAGEVIARLTGAEAGLVTSGSAGGMLLQAAACMTGDDPAKAHRLPETNGMKNEIILHRAHLVNYEHNYRAAGAKQVHIGNVSATHEWELESAFNENTAAVAYIIGPRQGGALPLSRVIDMAHDHGVPVILDAAGMLPPVENLTRFVELGVDMVSFSGGKGILGPQSTGILCGRRDLIEAAYLNSAPNSTSVGRAAKVCKEEIAGLITALELFVDTDHEAVAAGWRVKCRHIVSELQDIPGVRAELREATPEHDEYESNYPRAFVLFDRSWNGPSSVVVMERLKDGDPSIRVREAEFTGGISIIPVALQDGEEEIIAQRLREILTGAG